jgi:hypothetical protein
MALLGALVDSTQFACHGLIPAAQWSQCLVRATKYPLLALLCLEGTNIRVITLRPILVLVQAPLKVILTPLKFFQLHLLGVKRVQVNSECTQGEHDDGSNLKFAFALFVCADFWNNAERWSGAMQLHRSFIAASSQQ